jgi:PTS system galactitol-specific IIC component
MAASSNYHITGYQGVFTSFLDGGQFFRAWWLKVFSGDLLSLSIVPAALLLVIFTWKITTVNRK